MEPAAATERETRAQVFADLSALGCRNRTSQCKCGALVWLFASFPKKTNAVIAYGAAILPPLSSTFSTCGPTFRAQPTITAERSDKVLIVLRLVGSRVASLMHGFDHQIAELLFEVRQ